MSARRGVAALRRLRRPAAPHDRCGLCSAPLPERHDHLLERATRTVECACVACALLFDRPTPGDLRYRRVGRRVAAVPGEVIESVWRQLDLPISLAFVATWTGGAETGAAATTVATSPSPLGVVDHPLRDDQVDALRAAHPAVGDLEPDVEALLVYAPRRPGTPRTLRAFVVPIDRCFALTNTLRQAWDGLHGGSRADDAIGAFFDALAAEVRA